MAKVVVQKNTRIFPNRAQTDRFLTPPRSGIAKQVEDWLSSSDSNYYLGFGGTGDALLTIASCWEDPKAKVLFFANNVEFTTEFFNLFKLKHFIYGNIMGQPLSKGIQDMVVSHPNFKTSNHLADNCDYGDWKNEDKYFSRMVTKVPWIEKFGKELSGDIAIVAPHGSCRDYARQRFLDVKEYNKLVNKLINKFKVYSIGSEKDILYYGIPNHPNILWISSNYITTFNGSKIKSSLNKLIRIINSASLVYSVDTWLKTYTLLNGINTKVIATRYNGKYKEFGEDITDWIFLNKKLWPSLEITRVEDLLA